MTFTDRAEGRYVILTLPGSRKILTLCEVEVYGYRSPTGKNMSYYINVDSMQPYSQIRRNPSDASLISLRKKKMSYSR